MIKVIMFRQGAHHDKLMSDGLGVYATGAKTGLQPEVWLPATCTHYQINLWRSCSSKLRNAANALCLSWYLLLVILVPFLHYLDNANSFRRPGSSTLKILADERSSHAIDKSLSSLAFHTYKPPAVSCPQLEWAGLVSILRVAAGSNSRGHPLASTMSMIFWNMSLSGKDVADEGSRNTLKVLLKVGSSASGSIIEV